MVGTFDNFNRKIAIALIYKNILIHQALQYMPPKQSSTKTRSVASIGIDI
jgi:hypothetical protein